MADSEWVLLPTECLYHIFSFLCLTDLCHAGMSCTTFHHISTTSSLWQSIRFSFYSPSHEKCVSLAERVAHHVRRVWIDIDQESESNRRSALDVLTLLSRQNQRRIHTFKITFSGENPCFYSGREFVDAMLMLFGSASTEEGTVSESLQDCDLLGSPKEGRPTAVSLTHLDFGKMSVTLNDHFLDVVSENNPGLQSVHIQTYPTYICEVSPHGLSRLIHRCRHLESLSVYKSSVNNHVIQLLLEPGRKSLLKLSLRHTSEDNNSDQGIPSETWTLLAHSLPLLRVTMAFDETCTSDVIIGTHLQPGLPVSGISMETTSFIFYSMVDLIVDNYKDTLEELELFTSIKPGAVSLGRSLVQVATACSSLTSLKVYSLLDESVIDKIQELTLNLDAEKSFLKHESWVIDTEIQVKLTDFW